MLVFSSPFTRHNQPKANNSIDPTPSQAYLETTFTHYSLEAKEGNLSCQYERGVMLMEGRGTKRDLNEAVNQFRATADAGHMYAQAVVEKIDTAHQQLREIAIPFDNPQNPSMPEALFNFIVDLVTTAKINAIATEKLTLTLGDLTSALEGLAQNGVNDEQNKRAQDVCGAYKKSNLGPLLQRILEKYNVLNKCQAVLLIEEYPLMLVDMQENTACDMSDEVWSHIRQHMSADKIIHLASTSTSHQKMCADDEVWKKKSY